MTTEQKKPTNLKAFAIGLIGGIIGAVLVLSAQSYIPQLQPKLFTVDIQMIAETKRQEIIEKYKGKYTDENAKLAENELVEFSDRFVAELGKVSRGRPVLNKNAVVEGGADVTDEMLVVFQLPVSGVGNARK